MPSGPSTPLYIDQKVIYQSSYLFPCAKSVKEDLRSFHNINNGRPLSIACSRMDTTLEGTPALHSLESRFISKEKQNFFWVHVNSSKYYDLTLNFPTLEAIHLKSNISLLQTSPSNTTSKRKSPLHIISKLTK